MKTEPKTKPKKPTIKACKERGYIRLDEVCTLVGQNYFYFGSLYRYMETFPKPVEKVGPYPFWIRDEVLAWKAKSNVIKELWKANENLREERKRVSENNQNEMSIQTRQFLNTIRRER